MLSNTDKCSVVMTSTSTKGWYSRNNEHGDLKTTSTGAPKKQESEDEQRKEAAVAALFQKLSHSVVENDTTTNGTGILTEYRLDIPSYRNITNEHQTCRRRRSPAVPCRREQRHRSLAPGGPVSSSAPRLSIELSLVTAVLENSQDP